MDGKFGKIEKFGEVSKLRNWAQKINLRSVLDVKFRQVPALGAIFRILAEPRMWFMGGGCA